MSLVLKSNPQKNATVTYGKRPPARDIYNSHVWVHNNMVEKNHSPGDFPFSAGERIDKVSIKAFFIEKPKDKEPIPKLNQETKDKIMSEMRFAHRHRYGTKLNKDMTGYITKRKTYDLEHMISDLEFVLGHLHLKNGE